MKPIHSSILAALPVLAVIAITSQITLWKVRAQRDRAIKIAESATASLAAIGNHALTNKVAATSSTNSADGAFEFGVIYGLIAFASDCENPSARAHVEKAKTLYKLFGDKIDIDSAKIMTPGSTQDPAPGRPAAPTIQKPRPGLLLYPTKLSPPHSRNLCSRSVPQADALAPGAAAFFASRKSENLPPQIFPLLVFQQLAVCAARRAGEIEAHDRAAAFRRSAFLPP